MKRGNHSVFELIGLGFKNWWKNPMIMMPFLFYFIATVIAVIVIGLVFSSIFIAAVGPNFTTTLLNDLSTESNSTALSPELSAALTQLFTPPNLIYFIIAVIVIVFILEAVKAYFYASATAMSKDIVNGKKLYVKSIWQTGKKYWLKYWAAEILIGIGILLWFLIFSLPYLISQNGDLILIPLISIIPLFFVLLFFILGPYLVVLKDMGPWQSLKESMKIIKKNYGAFLGLFILFVIMMSVVSWIPWIGSILGLFIITPAMIIAFVMFILERS